jgi:hypothetical protein
MIESETVERLMFGPRCTAVGALSRVPIGPGNALIASCVGKVGLFCVSNVEQ